jgi:fructokinase
MMSLNGRENMMPLAGGTENMFDVTAMGELLVDFTYSGTTESGQRLFESNPGGAPANVLVTVSKLGGTAAFLGKVGQDEFGQSLRATLHEHSVDTSGLIETPDYNTTLAFVSLGQGGERQFTFYRKHGADVHLTAEEVNYRTIEDAKVFHFGSVSLTQDPVRTATLKAAEFAKREGKLVSFDPNLRPMLWESMEEARELTVKCLQFADVLKVSEEELAFLSGSSDISTGLQEVNQNYDIPLILVTLGERGSLVQFQGQVETVPASRVRAVDTTGAGDSFVGGMLYQLTQHGTELTSISMSDMVGFARFANAVGGLVATKRGAIPAIPSLDAVTTYLNRQSKLST